MKIWFDLDGVVADWCKNILPIVNEIWSHKLAPDFYPLDYAYTGIFTDADWNIVWNEIRTRPDFWEKSPPIVENVSVLRTWLETTTHDVFYITSRMNTGGANASAQTLVWLIQQGLWDRHFKLIVVPKASDKKAMIDEHKIDMGIDDLPSTVIAANMLPWHRCFLLDQPWNRDSNTTRVNSLREFLDIVDRSTEDTKYSAARQPVQDLIRVSGVV